MKILIIEDEKQLLASMQEYLSAEGFTVETAENYNMGMDKILIYEYDCILVDITLPFGSGLNIIKELKNQPADNHDKNSKTGIIIISANNSIDDRIKGLNLGADDYITKPFHLSELNARIKALMRRNKFEGNKELLLNEIKIQPDERRVFVNAEEIILTAREYDLLLFFISNKNRVVTKRAIAEHLWGEYADDADSHDFVYTHIKNLRKKMLAKGCEDYVQTIYGIGYNFKIH